MAWLYLIIAGGFEVVWAVAMKESQGFTRFWPSLITLVGMAISVWFLSISMKVLPLGTAYVIWTGIGAIGSFLVGIFFLNEPATALRLVAATLIVSGLLLLKFATPA